MNYLLLAFLAHMVEEEEEAERQQQRRLKSRKRKREPNEEEKISDEQFLQQYRITKMVFQEIMDLIDEDITAPTRTAKIQVMTLLRVLAEGSSWKIIDQGDSCRFDLARMMLEILPILEFHLCPKFIKWPQGPMVRKRIREGFLSKWSVPSTLGIIDCTQVQLEKPSEEFHLYLNKNNVHSLNVSLICDNNGRFMAVDASHPGATGDAEIWSNSDERRFMEKIYDEDDEKCWLLADRSYPLEPWLISPYRVKTPNAIEFNQKFDKARSVMTRSIALLKSRWQILLYKDPTLSFLPEHMTRIVNVCVALHNMCILRNVPDVKIDPASRVKDDVVFDELNSLLPDALSLRDEGALNRELLKQVL
ncbi:putative nuclease HARBI1 [Sergentomyia squamirostris]